MLRKLALVGYAATVMLMCYYVPWRVKVLGRVPEFVSRAAIYSPINKPPNLSFSSKIGNEYASIETYRLNYQLFAATVFWAVIYFILPPPQKRKDNEDSTQTE